MASQKKDQHKQAWAPGPFAEEVIEELSRYTETEIVIADPSLANVAVGGYFKAGDVDALMYALTENFNIAWERQDENRIVLKPRRTNSPRMPA